jgi:hypothetical protein
MLLIDNNDFVVLPLDVLRLSRLELDILQHVVCDKEPYSLR